MLVLLAQELRSRCLPLAVNAHDMPAEAAALLNIGDYIGFRV